VLFLIAIWLFLNRQMVIDQVAYWQYKPSADIAALAERADMSDKGRYYFYASFPEVQDRQKFNSSCNTTRTQETVVLGCYTGRHIYIFDVEDAKLNGIKEVTAAHEMLHAAYERLDPSERDRVDTLLDKVAKATTDDNLKTLLSAYDKSEPGERLNELHSILGTQVRNLGPELENYYKQYFTNRTALVDLSDKYESVFNSLKSQQQQLASELEQLAQDLTAESNRYNQAISQLNADIADFNTRATSGSFSSQAQFNSERDSLVARQESLKVERNVLNAKIAQYNERRQALEAINSQAEALNRSINSNLSPVPAIN
jgi:chromosome segregation ATPase